MHLQYPKTPLTAHRPDSDPMQGANMKSQRGQSLVEMAVACIALVPMFLGVMVLGQYIHLRQQTQAAARAAAWDATVSPAIVNKAGDLPAQNTELDRMRALQFGKPEATLKNITAPTKLQDPMLTTFAGRELILANNVTLGTYTNTKSPALSQAALDAIGSITKVIGLGGFPPDGSGLITAEAHARPEHLTDSSGRAFKLLDPLDSMDLDFYGRTVLLADTWNANGPGENSDGSSSNVPRSVRNTITPLLPADWFGNTWNAGIKDIVGVLGAIPLVDRILTPGFKDLAPGKTAPDVVPSDKLVKYGTRP
jgi:hypothetical protein